jgi:hypothetical protein
VQESAVESVEAVASGLWAATDPVFVLQNWYCSWHPRNDSGFAARQVVATSDPDNVLQLSAANQGSAIGEAKSFLLVKPTMIVSAVVFRTSVIGVKGNQAGMGGRSTMLFVHLEVVNIALRSSSMQQEHHVTTFVLRDGETFQSLNSRRD